MMPGDLVIHISGDVGIVEEISTNCYTVHEYAPIEYCVSYATSEKAYYGALEDRAMVMLEHCGDIVHSWVPIDSIEIIDEKKRKYRNSGNILSSSPLASRKTQHTYDVLWTDQLITREYEGYLEAASYD